jgi:hypothetical protein
VALTLAQRVQVVSELAVEDLASVWSLSSPEAVLEALLDTLPLVIDTWGPAAATLAADWYDEERDKAGVRGRFTATIPDMGDTGAEELARWGVTPLFSKTPNWEAAQVLTEGGLQRRIANHSRKTVTVSSVADPQARGWQRITSGGSCGFCEMLASRGAIYTTKTADFAAHDHCNCSATPAWKGHKLPVRPYVPTSRTVTDADRARTREWIKANQ